MKKTHTIVAVLGIAVASGAAYWWQHRGSGGTVEATEITASAPVARPAATPVGGGGPGAAGPVVVEVGKVLEVRLQDEAQAVGTLRSRQGVILRPETSGRVVQLGFADGQRVRRGQMLVQLDDALQRAQLQQAQAQAAIARTNVQRNRELVAQNFVSQSALDQTAAALDVAEAQVALAQATLARMRLVAPFDGIAGIRLVNIGDYVREGADLVGIEDVSAMLVDFRLPEQSLARLRPGQPVELTLDAMPGRVLKGQVDAIDSTLDVDGRSLLVRARLTNSDGGLRPGLFARARIVFATRDNATVVPEEALVPQGGKQYLIKVVDAPPGQPPGKVSQRLEAKIGVRLPGQVEILQGLAAGDVVVTAGQARLMRGNGLPVRVVDVGAPAYGPALPASSGAAGAGAVRAPGDGAVPPGPQAAQARPAV